MKYTIIFKREAIKDLQLLPSKMVLKIKTAIDLLSETPRPTGCKKLEGSKENLWRIRIGDYRVIYLIDDGIKIINIRKIGNRKDIYE